MVDRIHVDSVVGADLVVVVELHFYFVAVVVVVLLDQKCQPEQDEVYCLG